MAAGCPLASAQAAEPSRSPTDRFASAVTSRTGQGARVTGARTIRLGAGAAQQGRRTKTFELVGATWTTGTLDERTTRLEVRVHRRDGWSRWRRLNPDDEGPSRPSPDAGADVRHRRTSASPIWVGSADGAQSRVVGRDGHAAQEPRRLHLVLIDGGHSAADAHPAPQRSRAASESLGGIAEPTIYSRRDWGANESLRHRNKGCGHPEYADTLKVAFVHHTDTGNEYSRAAVPGIIRSIYAYHVKANGWCDIGYNFLVDRFGRIWQGRYGGNARPVIGAHAGGFNTESVGVAMIGTFDYVRPDAAMRQSVARIIAWRLADNYRDPTGTAKLHAYHFRGSRYRAGRNVTFHVIAGHRDADYTDCPGRLGYRALPSIRRAALRDIGPGLVGPAVSATSLRYETPGVLTVSAHALANESWTFSVLDTAGTVISSQTGTARKDGAITATWDGHTDAEGSPYAPAGKYGLVLTPAVGGRSGVSWFQVVTVTPPVTITGPATAAYNSSVTLTGVAPAGEEVEVTISDTIPVYVTASPTGQWSTTFLASDDRTWNATALVDGVEDTTPTGTTKVGPVIVSPTPTHGVLRPSRKTFTVSGTALPAAGTVTVAGVHLVLGKAAVAADGTWSVRIRTGRKATIHVTDGRGVRSPTYTVRVS